MSVGTKLRQAREAQTITLDQASQATHIRLHYLEALEADRFDLLPSSAQLRGFIRAYGQYLKLDPAELLRVLDGGLPVSTIETPPTSAAGEIVSPTASSDAIFKEVGDTLRSQRELMGLSLGDVERHTHIRMHYVQALECGDISHLPSAVQGRGMLSNYATFLGLNTEAILLRFADGLQASLYSRQAARIPAQDKPGQNVARRELARPSPLRRLFSVDLFVSGFLIVFLLGFAVWGALRVSSIRSAQEPSPTSPPVAGLLAPTQGQVITATLSITPTGATSLAPTAAIELPLDPGATPVSTAQVPFVLEPTPFTDNAPIQVVVIPRQRAWVRITVDGETAFQGRMVPGSAYSFGGNERIVLLTGDAGSLHVYFNQQDLGYLGSSGEVFEQVYSIEGAQTATPAVPPTRTPAPTGTVTPTPSGTPTGIPVSPTSTLKP